jgi:hypothetical protein
MVEKAADPLRRGGSRSADDELGVDVPNGCSGDVVEPEVLLRRAAPEHVEVGLVPDLEAPPVAHLGEPVPLDEVSGE